MEGMRNEYHRYDIIEAEIKMTTPSGSVQKKKRPYVIVGNEKGTTTPISITHGIKAISTGFPIMYDRNIIVSSLKTHDKNKEKTILFAEKGIKKLE